MLTLFGKKRLQEAKLANVMINTIVDRVERAFPDVAGLINEAPEFASAPNIAVTDSDKFLMIVVVANLKQLTTHFTTAQDNALTKAIMLKMADIFDTEPSAFSKITHEYRAALTRVSYPSKNLVAAMSKMLFHRYGLNRFQDVSFREINQPNPLFVQRMNEVMEHFLWNWDEFLREYKITH